MGFDEVSHEISSRHIYFVFASPSSCFERIVYALLYFVRLVACLLLHRSGKRATAD